MKTKCFDAALPFPPPSAQKTFQIVMVVEGKKIPAALSYYETERTERHDDYMVQVIPNKPLSLRWKDKFEIKEDESGKLLGSGIVLNPFSSVVRGKKIDKRKEFLQHLRGDQKEMLYSLIQEQGVKGLREKELLDFTRLTLVSLRELCQNLEEEGKIRIISFSPLFLVSHKNLSFLQEKVIDYLERFHKTHPAKKGISREKIKKRFGLSQKIMYLTLKHLIKQGKVEKSGDLLALSTFKMSPTLGDEQILKQLEELYLKGEFQSVSQREMMQRFNISPDKLNTMLSLLVGREKIVKGKDGFFIHSHWLDEIISKVKKHNKNELTVSDFKGMTGLTRKYAIPLLELLDQMGITRRISPSSRKIL